MRVFVGRRLRHWRGRPEKRASGPEVWTVDRRADRRAGGVGRVAVALQRRVATSIGLEKNWEVAVAMAVIAVV